MPLWCSAARRDYVANDSGGAMLGGPPRAVWHTTEGSSIAGAVSVYRDRGFWPHLTWDPRSGEIQQHVPANLAGRAMRRGTVQTNRLGIVCVQIEVVGTARVPFTSGPMVGFGEILGWLDSLGIPRLWPAGRPLAYGADGRRPGVDPAAYGEDNGTRVPLIWYGTAGHFGHSQVAGNDHGDPGAVDTGRWLREDTDMTPEQAAQLTEVLRLADDVQRRCDWMDDRVGDIQRRVDSMDDRVQQAAADAAWTKTAVGQVRSQLAALVATLTTAQPGTDPATLRAAAYDGARKALTEAGLPVE